MGEPTYGLHLVKGLMEDGSWVLTETARDTATELGFDEEDVYDCIVRHLAETHFFKTMESEKKPGCFRMFITSRTAAFAYT
jgi:hypothetical protein